MSDAPRAAAPTQAPEPTRGPTPRRPGLLDRLRGLIDTLYREMLKFGIVGAVAFVVDMGSFNLLRHTVLSHKPTTATILSAALATVVAWIGNRVWTFRHRRNRPVHHEAALFLATNGVAMGVQVGVIAFTHYVLLLQTITADNISKFIGIVLGTLLRFWAYRTFVFAGVAQAEPVDSEPPADHHEAHT